MGKPNFYGEEKELGCCTQFFRYLLMLINFIFVIAGIAGIAVSAVMLHKKDTSYLNFCHVCQRFNYVTIAAFACLFLFSLLGLRALWKRSNCALIVYGLYLVIFFIISLAIGIVIVMIHNGKFESELRTSWEDSVSDDPDGLCDFMTNVECSGWDNLCDSLKVEKKGNTTHTDAPAHSDAPDHTDAPDHSDAPKPSDTASPRPSDDMLRATETTAPKHTDGPETTAPKHTDGPETTAPKHTDAPETDAPTHAPNGAGSKPPAPAEATVASSKQCAPCKGKQAFEVVSYTKTCKTKLHDEVNKYYKPLIIVIFSLAGTTFLSLVISCKVRREFIEYNEVNDNFV